MPSRWQHRSFPISVPPTRRPMATIHREDTTMKIPEQGDEAEAPPRTTETEKDHIQRKEEGLHSDCIGPHPGSTALYQEGPSGPIVSPVEKREAQVDT